MQFGQLQRREFITLLGGSAAMWPLAARAQQPAKLPKIGFLGPTTPAAMSNFVASFVGRLGELGWVDGRTVAIDYRYTGGRNEQAAEIAIELVGRKVDVIVTAGPQAVLAIKRATSAIPIVFALAHDPVGNGLVASLGRPGGNVTGLSVQQTDLAGKRIELLREAYVFRRLGILANAGDPGAVVEMGEVEAVARTLGIEVATFHIQRAEDLEAALEAFKDQVQAIYVVADPLVFTHRSRIGALAIGERLPTMHAAREYVEAGGLMSYGPNFGALFRRAAEFVDNILHGTKPADIPVEQPTKFDLVINQTTARALGLDVAPTLLALADEVIE
jgi:putative tryptophan/tyrosine transport system substrate-binding protein